MPSPGRQQPSSPTQPPSAVSLLDLAALRRLDEAALAVLADVGVAIGSQRAREALKAAGASIDGQLARLSPELVRRLIASAPAQISLGARDGDGLMTGCRPLLTTDGCCAEVFDLESGVRRATTLDDVVAATRLADGLSEVDFCWPSMSALDRPVERRGLYELAATIANTTKHVQTVTVVDARQAEVAVALARCVAGDADEVRRRPPISALLGTVTPLATDGETLDAGLVFAAAGIPVGFVSMPMGGSTAPLTMAGCLVVALAEVLCGVCVIQAAVPGAPVFISFIPSFMDLRSGDFTGGAPEDTLMAAAVGCIGDYYRLPTQCGVNASGAKGPDWQAALDDASTTLLSLRAGVDMLTGVGMVAAGRVFSYEEMIMGAGITTRARQMLAAGKPEGGLVDDGALRRSQVVDQGAAAAWVRELLNEHEPPPLSQRAAADFKRLIESA